MKEESCVGILNLFSALNQLPYLSGWHLTLQGHKINSLNFTTWRFTCFSPPHLELPIGSQGRTALTQAWPGVWLTLKAGTAQREESEPWECSKGIQHTPFLPRIHLNTDSWWEPVVGQNVSWGDTAHLSMHPRWGAHDRPEYRNHYSLT